MIIMDENTRKRFFSSKDQKWATPKWLFDRFNEVFSFKLDPCCVPKTAKCSIYYTPDDDGLKQDWAKIGNAFVNPPYSRDLPKWVEKSYLESEKGIIVGMLIPARPDTKAWHKYCLQFGIILFLKGRIIFEDQRDKPMKNLNPAFFPSALVVFGKTKGFEIEKLKDLGYWMVKAEVDSPIPPEGK